VDPNSKNQRWSHWQFYVYADGTKRPDFQTVKENCARFGRLVFGSVSEMKVACSMDEDKRLFWDIEVRTEGHPVHDPMYTEWMGQQWVRFFQEGFGQKVQVKFDAKLEAGDRQDGKPADQLIMLPSVFTTTKLLGG
jgi:hypothetical protein